MYILVMIIFGITALLSVVAMIMHGFNVVFLYILLFSLVVAAWSVAAFLSEKKGKNGNS